MAATSGQAPSPGSPEAFPLSVPRLSCSTLEAVRLDDLLDRYLGAESERPAEREYAGADGPLSFHDVAAQTRAAVRPGIAG